MSLSLTVTPEVTEVTLDLSETGLTLAPDVVDVTLVGESVDLTVESSPVELTASNTVIGLTANLAAVEIVTVAEQGPPGVDATGQRSFAFAWGDATPALLMSADAGQMVLGVTVSIDEPFDGVGAAISVGDAGDDGSLIDADMIEPTIVGAFQNAPCLRFVSSTQLFLTITPGTGASTGSGVVSLFLE